MLLFCDGFDDYGSIWQRYDTIIYDGAGAMCISNVNVPMTPRTGRACLVSNDERFSFSGTRYIGKNIPATATLIVGFAYFLNTGNRTFGDLGIVGFLDAANLQVDLRVTNTGTFYFTRNGTMLGTPTTANFTFNSWHYIEVQVTINNTTGVCILKVDGTQYINLTSQNTRTSANNQATQIFFGYYNFPGSQIAPQYQGWDDVYICDTTGSFNNTFLGDVAVKSNVPTGLGGLTQYSQNTTAWAASTVMWIGRRIKDSNGNIQEVTACVSDIKTGGSAPTWNVSLGGTTTDNHVTWTNRGADSQILEVNEVPVMGINDWLSAKNLPLGYAFIDRNLNIQLVTTAGTTNSNSGGAIGWNTTIGGTTGDGTAVVTNMGQLSSFEDMYISDATVTDQSRFTFPGIAATTVYAVAVTMRVRKDDSLARAVRGVAKSTGTTGTSPTDLYLSTTYQIQQGIFEADPHTSAAWTTANVNAAEFGIETTV